MGCVIRMNSEEFIADFLKEFNPDDFQFILISENITTKRRYKNVMPIKALIPPPNVAQIFINDGMCKSYESKYFDYLKKKDVEALITIIAKSALSGMNLVLICSKSEDDFKYLKIICQFIEEEYRLKTYTLKRFMNDPRKASKIKNDREVTSILMKKMEKLHENVSEINPNINEDSFIKKLKKFSKKELTSYCKNRIKIKSNMSKRKIRKKIIDKLFNN